LFERLRKECIDVAFVALHGKFGEDGCVQGLLEMMRIPYTGGGVMGSSVGMDKVVCDMVALQLGIPVPREQCFNINEESPEAFMQRLAIPYPVIVKPSREGSTINITTTSGDAWSAGGRRCGGNICYPVCELICSKSHCFGGCYTWYKGTVFAYKLHTSATCFLGYICIKSTKEDVTIFVVFTAVVSGGIFCI
jgi:hypothetical protein